MLRMNFIKILFYINCLIDVEGAKILSIYPTPAYSHQSVFSSITKELLKHGHEVIVIKPGIAVEEAENITVIEIMPYPSWKKVLLIEFKKHEYHNLRMRALMKSHKEMLETILQNNLVKKLIKSDVKFDLILVEGWVKFSLAFSHVFKAPVITVGSLMEYLHEHHVIGSTVHPVLYPSGYQQRIQCNTMLEQVNEVWTRMLVYNMQSEIENDQNKILKEKFRDIEPLSKLNHNVDMLFLNVYPIWDLNRPVPISMVYGGALNLKPAKELPENLEAYLNSSIHGVIYVSFGTNLALSSLPSEGIKTMVRVLSSLPFDVLGKWDLKEYPGQSKNIKFTEWVPQGDLLRHPKVKLFVTQCGLQSTDEAIAAGVPMVALPLVGDQWYNAENCVKHKLGVKVEMETITDDEFRNAIEKVIGDDSYRQNTLKFGALLRDMPQTASERITWWIKYILRHGAKHIRAPAHNMSLPEYLEIELLIIVSICFILLGIIIILSIYCTMKYFLSYFRVM